ncbi:hypothetical protein [Corynebacterium pygosceleis]|uniref:Uncharacterized protein n=1 Tax=Corynebacterium pygosceleis TaxID=2800406 RepID=A0A9Q4GJ10_9CORY|nr:hypothetical protein [Corynebacterium pygosceleis]MCK7638300.1 hypothetical protein [Corynebacterium pygosceleis]MCK7675280.1 hypothetical protein [Corynebacterium pygosceleis]MCX7468963.1 hypothetical protein [Corynebacterium pygosceleis]
MPSESAVRRSVGSMVAAKALSVSAEGAGFSVGSVVVLVVDDVVPEELALLRLLFSVPVFSLELPSPESLRDEDVDDVDDVEELFEVPDVEDSGDEVEDGEPDSDDSDSDSDSAVVVVPDDEVGDVELSDEPDSGVDVELLELLEPVDVDSSVDPSEEPVVVDGEDSRDVGSADWSVPASRSAAGRPDVVAPASSSPMYM